MPLTDSERVSISDIFLFATCCNQLDWNTNDFY